MCNQNRVDCVELNTTIACIQSNCSNGCNKNYCDDQIKDDLDALQALKDEFCSDKTSSGASLQSKSGRRKRSNGNSNKCNNGNGNNGNNGNGNKCADKTSGPTTGSSASRRNMTNQPSDHFLAESVFLNTYMKLSEASRLRIGHSFESFIKECNFRGEDCHEIFT